MLTTLSDILAQLTDFIGANAGDKKSERDARQAMLRAYREFASAATWSFFHKLHKLRVNASYSTGTIEYEHSSGTSPRLVTLTDGTWPEWAAYGVVLIGNFAYEVAERLSDTTLTLTFVSNPGDDVAADTAYSLVRDSYPMPTDFIAADQIIGGAGLNMPVYVPPGKWSSDRTLLPMSGQPWCYTFMGDDRYQSTMSVRFYPAPSTDDAYEFTYLRRGRPFTTMAYKTGTATATQASLSVAGTGTAWTEDMEGAVIRFAANSLDYPTDIAGANPFTVERVITSVTSATALTIDEIPNINLPAVKYVISDPIDLEEGVMLNAFLACAQMHIGRTRNKKEWGDLVANYRRDLSLAREADCRTALLPRASGGGSGRTLPMREFNVGSTVS